MIWQLKKRMELFKGRLLPLTAPNVDLNEVYQVIFKADFGIFFTNQPCKLFSASFDVQLPLPVHKLKDYKIDTMVQPDLCVICDLERLDEQGCIGAPDLIIEILSPSNSRREIKDKFELYEEANVLEYWVIDPVHNLAFTYQLDKATHKFVPTVPVLTDQDSIKSTTFKGLTILLADIFSEDINIED